MLGSSNCFKEAIHWKGPNCSATFETRASSRTAAAESGSRFSVMRLQLDHLTPVITKVSLVEKEAPSL